MSTLAIRNEIAASNRQTRRTTIWSFVGHTAALLLWLIYHQVSPQVPELVEVEWIEPDPVVAASPAPVETADPIEEVEPPSIPTPTEKQPERFERPEVAAETVPVPQRPDAANDKLRASLDRLKAPTSTVPTLNVERSRTSETVRPAVARSEVPGRSPTSLERKAAPPTRSAPAELQRTARVSSAPDLARVSSPQIESTRPRMAEVDENTARRSIEGAMLIGPVADRPLRERSMPSYPVWAREEGIEASVTLSFLVAPDGRVRPNVVVEKTSGHEDFDRNARRALSAWLFAALDGSGADQWGTITFNFRLRDQ